LIEDLLDVSRLSKGKIHLRTEVVDLASVLARAVESVTALVKGRGHELTISVPREPMVVEGDPTRLEQVFGNLLTNAAKYMEEGGRIAVEAEAEGEGFVVRVRDTGEGIAAEMLPRLFEMYTQVESSRQNSLGGLGIGLSLVKGLVELHGGSVEARSDGIGRGAQFVVRLPAASGAAPAAEPRARAPLAQERRHRIMVADDNRDAADTLASMLKLFGHEVCIAYDGQEAVELAERFQPDLALLDIGMPRLNGYDAARTIRSQPRGREIKIVALSGWGQPEDKRRSQSAGFDEHLVKPVDPATLGRLLAGH
jgi:CheY-like chemotaxis protein/two-component sensor histidine kinase